MRYFDALVSPVAVFAAGRRTMYKTDMDKFDVLFRRLFRTFVRPPAGMDWTRPWDETLHDWNGQVNECAVLHGTKVWSQRCGQQYRSLAHYISPLEDEGWVKRLMQWRRAVPTRGGNPAHLWHTLLTNFCRGKVLRDLELESKNYENWMKMPPEFHHVMKLLMRCILSRADTSRAADI